MKGLKTPPTLSELESKLYINSPSLEITQEKWSRSSKEGFIKIENSPYDIKVTSNKRLPIFNDKGKLIGTKNIQIPTE